LTSSESYVLLYRDTNDLLHQADVQHIKDPAIEHLRQQFEEGMNHEIRNRAAEGILR